MQAAFQGEIHQLNFPLQVKVEPPVVAAPPQAGWMDAFSIIPLELWLEIAIAFMIIGFFGFFVFVRGEPLMLATARISKSDILLIKHGKRAIPVKARRVPGGFEVNSKGLEGIYHDRPNATMPFAGTTLSIATDLVGSVWPVDALGLIDHIQQEDVAGLPVTTYDDLKTVLEICREDGWINRKKFVPDESSPAWAKLCGLVERARNIQSLNKLPDGFLEEQEKNRLDEILKLTKDKSQSDVAAVIKEMKNEDVRLIVKAAAVKIRGETISLERKNEFLTSELRVESPSRNKNIVQQKVAQRTPQDGNNKILFYVFCIIIAGIVVTAMMYFGGGH